MNQPLRTLIVDDESLARRGLRLRLEDHPDLELVGECDNGWAALDAVAELRPDLMLLDIQMPGMDGFEVVRRLQSDSMPMIVFVTAFDQYAVEAFEINAVDYVLKPVEEERLKSAIERAVAHHLKQDLADQKQNLVKVFMEITGADPTEVEELASGSAAGYPDRLSIRDGDETRRVPVAEIDWVDAAGDYMCVHTGQDTHIMRITMKQLESMLNPLHFLRIHRSTIVNSQRIESARHLSNGEYLLSLTGGAQLKVSRTYRDRVKDLTNPA
jgi:two-component system LytT family response regulator